MLGDPVAGIDPGGLSQTQSARLRAPRVGLVESSRHEVELLESLIFADTALQATEDADQGDVPVLGQAAAQEV